MKFSPHSTKASIRSALPKIIPIPVAKKILESRRSDVKDITKTLTTITKNEIERTEQYVFSLFDVDEEPKDLKDDETLVDWDRD